MLAAIGVLAGAVTHLIWDAFTHDGARGVRMIPWLEDPIVDIGNHHLVGTHLMQDVSSLVGLAIVLLWVGYGLRGGHTPHVHDRLLRATERRIWVAVYWAGAAGMTVLWLIAGALGGAGLHLLHSGDRDGGRLGGGGAARARQRLPGDEPCARRPACAALHAMRAGSA